MDRFVLPYGTGHVHIELRVPVNGQTAMCEIDIPLQAMGLTGISGLDRKIISQFQALAIKDILEANAAAFEAANEKVEGCAICSTELSDPCSQCRASPMLSFNTRCKVVKGVCTHMYHQHCIDEYLKTNLKCPHAGCDQEWDFIKYILSIVTPTGEVHRLNVTGDARIKELKVLIDDKLGTKHLLGDKVGIAEQLSESLVDMVRVQSKAPLDRLRLVFNGMALEDDEKVRALGIKHKSKILLEWM